MLNKIYNFFFGKKEEPQKTEVPYKMEPPTVSNEEKAESWPFPSKKTEQTPESWPFPSKKTESTEPVKKKRNFPKKEKKNEVKPSTETKKISKAMENAKANNKNPPSVKVSIKRKNGK